MSNEFKIEIDMQAIKAIRKKYGEELTRSTVMVTEKYMKKGGYIQTEARRIIEEAGQVDTKRLIGSIKPSIIVYANKVRAEINVEMNAGTNYAIFVHEGTERHYVPFASAPGLLVWAERHGIVYRKTKTGKTAKRNSNALSDNASGLRSDKYYFYSKKTGKEYSIDIRKGGMKVSQRPLKFFEIPFEKYAPKYIKELENLLK